MRSCQLFQGLHSFTPVSGVTISNRLFLEAPFRNRCAIRGLKSAGVILSKFKTACSHHEITKGCWYKQGVQIDTPESKKRYISRGLVVFTLGEPAMITERLGYPLATSLNRR